MLSKLEQFGIKLVTLIHKIKNVHLFGYFLQNIHHAQLLPFHIKIPLHKQLDIIIDQTVGYLQDRSQTVLVQG